MSSAKKPMQARTVRVSPTVTDAAMRNPRGPGEMLLSNELGDIADVEEVIFDNKNKTKEEQNTIDRSNVYTESSTLLVVAFALIVIALIVIIVWMVMRGGVDKKIDDDMKRLIRPHPRNGMPGLPRQQNRGDSVDNQLDELQPQQQAMQQQMEQLNNELTKSNVSNNVSNNVGGTTAATNANPNRSFADAMAAIDANEKHKLPVVADDTATGKQFTKNEPHSSILRPTTEFSDDVDDVMSRTNAMLKASQSKKNKHPGKEQGDDLTDLDKSILAKIDDN